ncbi:lasso peptide biosynthesis B2 protein [Spirosoma sp. KNUC1025]|uniref:lasso peptide biosynthesis B2 protein n=1 Tax=Spirosoma sp. KNUC1025 TaxID=2894082 RepID=UPI00386A3E61
MRYIKRFFNKFSKFTRLSLSDKLLIIQSAILVVGLRFFLKFISFTKLYHILKFFYRKPTYYYREYLDYTMKARWAVNIAGNNLLRTRCLGKALALQILLNRRRIISDLHIGYIRLKTSTSAHAWLTSGDSILIGDDSNIHLYFQIPID